MINAINMPFCPPNIWPINISKSVSAVSKNAVLKAFPMDLPYEIDAAIAPEMHRVPIAFTALPLPSIPLRLLENQPDRDSAGILQRRGQKDCERRRRDTSSALKAYSS